MTDITELKNLLPTPPQAVTLEAMDEAIRNRHRSRAPAADTRTAEVTIRHLQAQDSLEEITSLLHRAYVRLAGMGLNFTAVDQSVEITAKRFADGQGFVAESLGVIAGTITVCGPYDPEKSKWALQTEWFYRKDTAHFHQLGVDPPFQGFGIGDKLVQACEDWAVKQGYAFMALDTAAPADHLRTRYQRLGYREMSDVQWEGKVYRSVIMVKQLGEEIS
jgi:GNAT superfamily N-acetyltransferase